MDDLTPDGLCFHAHSFTPTVFSCYRVMQKLRHGPLADITVMRRWVVHLYTTITLDVS